MKQTRPRKRKKETWIATRIGIDIPMESDEKMEADVFIEQSTGKVRMFDMVPATNDLTSFSSTLWKAIAEPAGDEKAYRPGRLVVDRAELKMAAQLLAKEQDIELEVDPDATAFIKGMVSLLEDEFSDGPGLQYLVDEDVDPALVSAFYTAAYDYLEETPWDWLLDSDCVEIEGLDPSPLLCSVLGAGGQPGLAIYLTPESAEQYFSGEVDPLFDTPPPSLAFMLQDLDDLPPGLALELSEHRWKTHPLGAAVLMRADRPERLHPTNDELRLMSSALEAVTRLAEAEDDEGDSVDELVLTLSTGQKVTVRYTDPPVDEDGLVYLPDSEEEACRRLDALWDSGQIQEALNFSGVILDVSYEPWPRVMHRAARYLLAKGMTEDLMEFWRDFSSCADPAWLYIGALAELELGHKPGFKKRLKKAVKKDPALGRRLLDGSSDMDEYATIWRPVWSENSQARKGLAKALGLD
jgi:Domain of unknown function (DUF6930)